MPMWTVYDHPTDYPGTYVARLWYLLPRGEATDEVLTAATLPGLRLLIAKRTPWLVPVPRFEDDDLKIIEVWI